MAFGYCLPAQEVLVPACLCCCRSFQCCCTSRQGYKALFWYHLNLEGITRRTCYGTHCLAVYKPDPVNPMTDENKNLRKYAEILSDGLRVVFPNFNGSSFINNIQQTVNKQISLCNAISLLQNQMQRRGLSQPRCKSEDNHPSTWPVLLVALKT